MLGDAESNLGRVPAECQLLGCLTEGQYYFSPKDSLL